MDRSKTRLAIWNLVWDICICQDPQFGRIIINIFVHHSISFAASAGHTVICRVRSHTDQKPDNEANSCAVLLVPWFMISTLLTYINVMINATLVQKRIWNGTEMS